MKLRGVRLWFGNGLLNLFFGSRERFEGLSYRISLISLRVSLKRVSISWIIRINLPIANEFWGWMELYRIKKRRGEIETSQNEYQIINILQISEKI